MATLKGKQVNTINDILQSRKIRRDSFNNLFNVTEPINNSVRIRIEVDNEFLTLSLEVSFLNKSLGSHAIEFEEFQEVKIPVFSK